jgi:methyl-accepting chemotaxis protein
LSADALCHKSALETWLFVPGSKKKLTAVSRLQKLATGAHAARKIIDNPLMQPIYTGPTDEIGAMALAMKIRASGLRAVVGRISDSSLRLKSSAESLADTIVRTNVRVHEQQPQTDAEEINSNVAAISELGQDTADEVHKNGEIGQELIQEAQRQQQLVYFMPMKCG